MLTESKDGNRILPRGDPTSLGRIHTCQSWPKIKGAGSFLPPPPLRLGQGPSPRPSSTSQNGVSMIVILILILILTLILILMSRLRSEDFSPHQTRRFPAPLSISPRPASSRRSPTFRRCHTSPRTQSRSRTAESHKSPERGAACAPTHASAGGSAASLRRVLQQHVLHLVLPNLQGTWTDLSKISFPAFTTRFQPAGAHKLFEIGDGF